MGDKTKISWADASWNPVTGCSRVSDGCKHCYAEALSLRFGWTPKPWAAANAAKNVKLRPDRLDMPRRWQRPRHIFVNSMSDLFHELVPDEFIAQVFAVMAETPRHTYQILTKRPERAAAWPGPWPAHIWMGTSVEDERVAHRIDTLRQCGAHIRFLSCEPLIGPITSLDFTGIHWVIAGGESGANFRPMEDDWVRAIRDACIEQAVPFWFKQQAARRSESDPVLDGREWRQMPGVTQAVLL